MLNAAMQYVVIPVAGFVWHLHGKIGKHETQIAVIETRHEADVESRNRELAEFRQTVNMIFGKLENIEQSLRSCPKN